jgi:hypothetical protein
MDVYEKKFEFMIVLAKVATNTKMKGIFKLHFFWKEKVI